MKTRYILLILLIIPFADTLTAAPGDTPKEAYTVFGEGVLLYPDGTWKLSGKPGVFEVDTNGIRSYGNIDLKRLLPARVTEVYDGDTFTVVIPQPPPGIQEEERIRLLGIDAPEMDGTFEDVHLGVFARDYAEFLVKGKHVLLAFESVWRDRFGRLLAYVYRENGSLVNAQMLRGGYAPVYRDIRTHFHEDFLALEEAARAQRVGIWETGDTGITISYIHNSGYEEYVEIVNLTGNTADLSGWSISDSDANVMEIPRKTVIPPGGILRIYSGRNGRNNPPLTLYLQDRTIWNNSGDTARLYDASGKLRDEYAYDN